MQLATLSQSATMSSLEIAELCEKEHKNVLADIRRVLQDVGIEDAKFLAPYKMPSGQTANVYSLPKRECDLVVSGYSAKYRLAIIDRWQELESKQVHKIPQTLSEALLLGAELAKKVEEQAAKLEAQKPMMIVYDKLADRKQDVSTTIVAKHLGTTAIKLNQFLREKGVKMLGIDAPKAGYMDWFNLVSDVSKAGHEFHQCLVTPLGQLKIAEMWDVVA